MGSFNGGRLALSLSPCLPDRNSPCSTACPHLLQLMSQPISLSLYTAVVFLTIQKQWPLQLLSNFLHLCVERIAAV
jgi:hypothetical protein